MKQGIRHIRLKPSEGISITLYGVTGKGNHITMGADTYTSTDCVIHSVRIQRVSAPAIQMAPVPKKRKKGDA